jgi:hypothetical protein
MHFHSFPFVHSSSLPKIYSPSFLFTLSHSLPLSASSPTSLRPYQRRATNRAHPTLHLPLPSEPALTPSSSPSTTYSRGRTLHFSTSKSTHFPSFHNRMNMCIQFSQLIHYRVRLLVLFCVITYPFIHIHFPAMRRLYTRPLARLAYYMLTPSEVEEVSRIASSIACQRASRGGVRIYSQFQTFSMSVARRLNFRVPTTT